MFDAATIVQRLTEGDEDLKDFFYPDQGQWTFNVANTRHGWIVQYFFAGVRQGTSAGLEDQSHAELRGKGWISKFNALMAKRPFKPKSDQASEDVWPWYYGFVNESAGDDLEFKDLMPVRWSIKLFKDPDGNWNAQMFNQTSPYGVVATDPDREAARIKGQQWADKFNADEPPSEPLEESSDDDELGKMSDYASYAKGSRVTINTGKYAGANGTVVGYGNLGRGESAYYVHADDFEDPNDCILYSPDQLKPENLEQPFQEAMEDSASIDPKFSYLPVGKGITGVYGNVFDVYVETDTDNPEDLARANTDKRWIGRASYGQVGHGVRKYNGVSLWTGITVPPKKSLPQPEFFDSLESAAAWFWRYQQLSESTNASITKIISEVIEDDDIGDDFVKGMGHDPVLMCSSALSQAGFTVSACKREGDSIIIVATWSSPNAVARLNGAKRINALVEPFIGKLRDGTFRYEHVVDGSGSKVTKIIIRKRLDDDPTLWKVEKRGNSQSHTTFFTISFNGQPVAEIYTTDHGAALVREEMAALHKVLPFYPQGWDMPGDTWAHGRAATWWRLNRKKLSPELRVGEHYLDKSLTKET